jgi:DNA-binding NtrC family response regulator
VETPSLREQLDDRPEDLRPLVGYVLRQVFEAEPAAALVDDIGAWIEANLGPTYPWRGNFRELEQCVRNVLIRGEYRPPQQGPPRARERLSRAFLSGDPTADEILAQYCTLVYSLEGSYDGTARRLGLDRRTVRKKVDPKLLEELRGDDGGGASGIRRRRRTEKP